MMNKFTVCGDEYDPNSWEIQRWDEEGGGASILDTDGLVITEITYDELKSTSDEAIRMHGIGWIVATYYDADTFNPDLQMERELAVGEKDAAIDEAE